MTPLSQLLKKIEGGDACASAELLPLVYGELRKLAAAKLAQERPGQTLQATGLVHEAYLRLVEPDHQPVWENRAHFFAAAAEAMRRILVDNARRKHRIKRGGDLQRIEFHEELLAIEEPREDLLALDEALQKLAVVDKQAADLVQLRYFAGCSVAEAAEMLEISVRTAGRLWAYAQAWLLKELEDHPHSGADVEIQWPISATNGALTDRSQSG